MDHQTTKLAHELSQVSCDDGFESGNLSFNISSTGSSKHAHWSKCNAALDSGIDSGISYDSKFTSSSSGYYTDSGSIEQTRFSEPKHSKPERQYSLKFVIFSTWQEIYEQDDNGDTQLHRLFRILHEHSNQLLNHLLVIIRDTPRPILLNIRNCRGQTALHLAVQGNHAKCVQYLITAGATVDVIDNHGYSPLHIAAANGYIACVYALLEPIQEQRVKELQLTHYAIKITEPRRKRVELNSYCTVGCTALHLALRNGHLDIFQLLVPFATDLNVPELLQGDTLLHAAVKAVKPDLVYLLICEGADVNALNYSNETPLYQAWQKFKYDRHNSQILSITNMLKDAKGYPEVEPPSEDEDMSDSDDDDYSPPLPSRQRHSPVTVSVSSSKSISSCS